MTRDRTKPLIPSGASHASLDGPHDSSQGPHPCAGAAQRLYRLAASFRSSSQFLAAKPCHPSFDSSWAFVRVCL
jgi:hypothetical protein